MFIKSQIFRYFSLMILMAFGFSASMAQSRVIAYQGSLTDGSAAASGIYQLQFSLFEAKTGGKSLQVISENAVPVTNGTFKVNLNFAASTFDGNAARYLEIAVKKASETDFTIMPTRQVIRESSYSIKTLSAAFDGENTAPVNIRPSGISTPYSLFGRPAAAVTYTTGQAIGGRSITINKLFSYSKLKITYMETFERPANAFGFNAQLFITVDGVPTYGNPGILSAIVFPVSNANFAYGQANLVGYVAYLPTGTHTVGVMVASSSVITFPRYQYLLEVEEVASFDSL